MRKVLSLDLYNDSSNFAMLDRIVALNIAQEKCRLESIQGLNVRSGIQVKVDFFIFDNDFIRILIFLAQIFSFVIWKNEDVIDLF